MQYASLEYKNWKQKNARTGQQLPDLKHLVSSYGHEQGMANEYDSSAVEVQSAIAIIEGSGHSGMNQDRGLKSADQMLACQRSAQERRLRPQADQILKCPRCESLNTKFCYYNNYSLTQPRHFCKNCKRYWTKGGALRNIPVGGGSRKNKRARQRNSDQSMLSSSSEELAQNGGHIQGTNNIVQLENLRSNMQLQDHSDGAVLSYDRIDDSTEILTGENSPVSINWPSAAVANLPISFQQHFDAGVLGMNLAKQDHQVSMNPNGDLCSLFDHQAPNSSAISEGFSTYTACYDETDGKGETHWRFPQQKLVALLQEGIQEGRNSYLQALEDDGTDLLRHVKGKLAQELIQVKSEEQAEWHHVEDGFLEPSNESGYWNNGNWS